MCPRGADEMLGKLPTSAEEGGENNGQQRSGDL